MVQGDTVEIQRFNKILQGAVPIQFISTLMLGFPNVIIAVSW
jgi:hypothetical protein